ncbi:hypothetical protein EV401DRAFT_2071896 [Pisolithus croceorrhizus]|nr:hypothetical protein EV401DRAFT_2071896 [Pisolithus croceorrhizus]
MSRFIDHSRGPSDGGDPCEQIFYPGHHSRVGPDDATSASSSLSSGDDSDSDVEDVDSTCRISVRGPTIRFRSRAPWETSDTEERDEPTHSLARLTAKAKGKSAADGFMRTLARASPVISRPSVESSYSQGNSTPLLEFFPDSGPHRAVLYHVSGHMPASSTSPMPVPSPTLPHNTELYGEGTSSLSSHHSSGEDTSSYTTRGHGSAFTSTTHHSYEDSRSSSDAISAHSRSPTPSSLLSQECSSREDFVHPYANPNLIVPYPSKPDSPSQRSNFKRSDSTTTVTDTISSRSTSSAIPRESLEVSPISKESQSGQRICKKEISSPSIVLHGDDINSAYLDRDPKFLSLHPPLRGSASPGWIAHHHSPPVPLISLQEAQAREKSRVASPHTGPVHSKAVDSVSRIPFSHPGELTTVPNNQNDSSRMSNSVRPRAQSISTSARAKTALHSMVGTTPHSEPHNLGPSSSRTSGSRALKHKKSGFLRLFSGRGDGDQPSPPPVPSLHDTYIMQGVHQVPLSKNRELHPLAHVPAAMAGSGKLSSEGGTETLHRYQDPGCESIVPTSRKLPPRSLNIDTGTSSHFTLTPSPGSDVRFRPHNDISRSTSSLPLSVPQSAPSTALDFQALQLRPVSSFSTHFAEYVDNSEADTPLDPGATSPTSNFGAMHLPLTPISSRPSNDEPHRSVGVSAENPSVINVLREQMLSTNKAWQQQVQELQQQIRVLEAKVEELRLADNGGHCEICRRVVAPQRLNDDESH